MISPRSPWPDPPSWYRFLPLAAVVITLLCFLPSLQNGWVNWDDEEYVLRNPVVQRMTAENLGKMWTTPEVLGLYHPLTLMSFALDHHFWGLDATGFHLSSLLLHLLNVWLVFLLMTRLGLRVPGAFLVALLFGIHPMHVESVAWISARKDVLYTAFFLLSLLAWLRYRRAEKRKTGWWLLALGLFMAALLSKASAMTLPLVLIAVDYLKGQARSWRSLGAVLPFFVLAVVAFLVAQSGQEASGATQGMQFADLMDGIFIGSRNVLVYLTEAIVPAWLSPFHPFPSRDHGGVPALYIWSIVPLIVGAVVLFRFARPGRKVIFGLLFFFITIAPLLQIMPFGQAVMAERYTYVPYIGLFWILGLGLDTLLQQRGGGPCKKVKGVILALGAVWLIFLGYRTMSLLPVWENGETLWSRVIERYPDHHFGYLSRGKYRSSADPEGALADLRKSAEIYPREAKTHYEMARMLEVLGQTEAARQAYDKALDLDPDHAKSWLNRGLMAAREDGNLEQAALYFSFAITSKPDYALAYLNRALARRALGDTLAATVDYGEAIRLEPWNTVFYRYRGSFFVDIGKTSLALADFSKAAELEPKNGENYFLMAKAELAAGHTEAARQYAEKAGALGFQVPEGFPGGDVP